MEAKLIVVRGKATRSEIRLKLPTTIGRRKDSGLVIKHDQVSRQHCEIFEREGRLYVRDNQSANGTFVNEHRADEVALYPGDKLRVGPLTFRVEYKHQGEPIRRHQTPPIHQSNLVDLLEVPEQEVEFPDLPLTSDAMDEASDEGSYGFLGDEEDGGQGSALTDDKPQSDSALDDEDSVNETFGYSQPRTIVPGSGLKAAPGSGTGSGLKGPGSGFQAPGSGLKGPGSGLTGPGSGLTGPGSGLKGPGSGLQTPGSGLKASGSGLKGQSPPPAVDEPSVFEALSQGQLPPSAGEGSSEGDVFLKMFNIPAGEIVSLPSDDPIPGLEDSEQIASESIDWNAPIEELEADDFFGAVGDDELTVAPASRPPVDSGDEETLSNPGANWHAEPAAGALPLPSKLDTTSPAGGEYPAFAPVLPVGSSPPALPVAGLADTGSYLPIPTDLEITELPSVASSALPGGGERSDLPIAGADLLPPIEDLPSIGEVPAIPATRGKGLTEEHASAANVETADPTEPQGDDGMAFEDFDLTTTMSTGGESQLFTDEALEIASPQLAGPVAKTADDEAAGTSDDAIPEFFRSANEDPAVANSDLAAFESEEPAPAPLFMAQSEDEEEEPEDDGDQGYGGSPQFMSRNDDAFGAGDRFGSDDDVDIDLAGSIDDDSDLFVAEIAADEANNDIVSFEDQADISQTMAVVTGDSADEGLVFEQSIPDETPEVAEIEWDAPLEMADPEGAAGDASPDEVDDIRATVSRFPQLIEPDTSEFTTLPRPTPLPTSEPKAEAESDVAVQPMPEIEFSDEDFDVAGLDSARAAAVEAVAAVADADPDDEPLMLTMAADEVGSNEDGSDDADNQPLELLAAGPDVSPLMEDAALSPVDHPVGGEPVAREFEKALDKVTRRSAAAEAPRLNESSDKIESVQSAMLQNKYAVGDDLLLSPDELWGQDGKDKPADSPSSGDAGRIDMEDDLAALAQLDAAFGTLEESSQDESEDSSR